MAYRWESARSVWLEDGQGGQFALECSDGLERPDWRTHVRGRVADMAQWLGATLPQQCTHGTIFPEDFVFCPTCGLPLQRAGSTGEEQAWWGARADTSLPRHVPHGLPVTTLPLAVAFESRAVDAPARADLSMPAAPNSVCVFAAAHFGFASERLLALAHSRGVLQFWDPNARLWHVFTLEEGAASLAFTAADYAWLPPMAARRGEVALVPTNQGLFRLWINPVNESYRTEALLQAPLASAPGALRQHIACLFAAGSELRLWSGNADGADPQVFSPQSDGVPLQGWMAPLSYDGRLMWLHEHGQLVWQPGQAPQWLAWPQGWTPRLRFGGATQSRDGRLWLIGHDGQAYSFLELGVAHGQQEAIAGARLGFASLLYRRGHLVLQDPWDSERIEDPHQNEAMVLPLLQAFNGQRDQPSGLVLRFEHYTGKAEVALESMVHPRTSVEWIGQTNVLLDQLIRLSRPGECLPFVYDNCLWLHHPDWNQIRGWRLKAGA